MAARTPVAPLMACVTLFLVVVACSAARPGPQELAAPTHEGGLIRWARKLLVDAELQLHAPVANIRKLLQDDDPSGQDDEGNRKLLQDDDPSGQDDGNRKLLQDDDPSGQDDEGNRKLLQDDDPSGQDDEGNRRKL